jgi:hypothetical protein
MTHTHDQTHDQHQDHSDHVGHVGHVGHQPHVEHSHHSPAGGGHDHGSTGGLNAMAVSATLHCLTGCAIGEITGLILGTALGLSTGVTIAVSIVLAFVFGYTLSTFPLLRAGLGVGAALSVVLAADTLSIASMEIVDNLVMAAIPGAMDAGLVNTIFWVGMMVSLLVAFFAAFPVNRYLLQRGKGHALTHEYHHGAAAPQGARRFIPSFATSTLVAAITAFLLGGLVVAVADDSGTPSNTHAAPLSRSTRSGAPSDTADVAGTVRMTTSWTVVASVRPSGGFPSVHRGVDNAGQRNVQE